MTNQLDFGFIEPEISIIAGVDEVGRGPLVGNVVAAAVILPSDCQLPLKDSKKLSEAKREWLAAEIKQQAVSYCVAQATPEEIDSLNILQATFLAMQRAIAGLDQTPEKVLVDGNRCPKIDLPCEAIVKGDGKIAEISAASILAKVERDRQMLELDALYPDYGFANHKGYPTVQHLAALEKYGLISDNLYRCSFKPVKKLLQNH